MGAIDQYSFLHFSTGAIVYFWNIKLLPWLIIHALFELIENTPIGINFINTYFKIWPGGKQGPDSFINSQMDNVFAMLGWLVSFYLDKLGNKYNWYPSHLN
jgi:hypothetical protein